MVLLWGALFAGGSWFFKKSGRSAVVLGLCVVSHWFLDLLVHRPDLPVMPSGELRLGIGLWNHPWISVPLEGLLFLAAAALYWREFRPSTRGRRLGLLALVMLLLGIWIGSLLGPPPPGIATVGAVGLAQWLFVAWAYRVDQRPGPLTG
ncbi:MAG: hypothetical protein NDJ89_04215 [Oligoflexia bacterium]|nr:hypothetical protein [Oligoflexia bacterium]